MRRLAASLLRWIAEAAVRIYYPRRTVEGRENLPPPGAAIYVANHPNGLLDPLVLRVTLGRAARFLAKSTLWGNPFGRLAMDAFLCLPVYRQQDVAVNARGETVARNEETFARCRTELAAGADLALYPEGTSHSDPQLKPLKTGAARIALGAAAAEAAEASPPGQPPHPLPRLVPVGSHYESPASFRSSVHLVVGPPIDLLPYVPRYEADPRAAIEALTEEIRHRLDELILQAETRELLLGIARVASWTANAPDDNAPERHRARTRELLAAYARLRASDPERLQRLTKAARDYARLLEKMGVRDPWALEIPRLSGVRVARVAGRLVLMTPAAAWGVVTSWVPYRLTGIAARKATKDEDVLSTMKMIGGAAILVAFWLLEALGIGLRFGAAVGLVSLLVAPVAGYATLRFGENLREMIEALRHLGWRARGDTVRRLAERRQRLAADVSQALRQSGS